MPFSGDTYTLPSNTCNPAVAATAINPTDFNALMADVEGALTTVKTLDSQKLSLVDGGTIEAAVTMDSTLDVTGAVTLASTLEVNDVISINVTAATDAIITGGNITADYIAANSGFIGDLVGNVTGDITGNVTGNCSGTAGAVAWTGITGNPAAKDQYGIATGTSGDSSTDVTFSTAYTTTAPYVFLAPLVSPGTVRIAMAANISTTGFTVLCYELDPGDSSWIAPTGTHQVMWHTKGGS